MLDSSRDSSGRGPLSFLTVKLGSFKKWRQWQTLTCISLVQGCLVQVGNGIELEAVGLQFKPYLWCDLGFFPNSRGNKAAANLRPTTLSCVGATQIQRRKISMLHFPVFRLRNIFDWLSSSQRVVVLFVVLYSTDVILVLCYMHASDNHWHHVTIQCW